MRSQGKRLTQKLERLTGGDIESQFTGAKTQKQTPLGTSAGVGRPEL